MWPRERVEAAEAGALLPASTSHVQLTKRPCLPCGTNPGTAHFPLGRAAPHRDTSLRRESFAC